MRLIVTVGWSIYPLGYLFGYLLGSVDDKTLNVVYNIADLLNEIGFCLAIWSCAKASTEEEAHKESLLPGVQVCARWRAFFSFSSMPRQFGHHEKEGVAEEFDQCSCCWTRAPWA